VELLAITPIIRVLKKGSKNMNKKIFTVLEYVPSYNCIESYYITYNLENKTITIDGITKPMSEYRYKKALEHYKQGA
jgi:mevalonate pyrophosphate decarboxylase